MEVLKIDKIQKLTGIYQITNKLNGKRYIGKSKNITYRWWYHLSNLIDNKHPNEKLQKDFNELGIASFEFSILELIDNINELSSLEQRYINNLNFNFDYNIYNATKEKLHDKDSFIKYINSRWLLPKDIKEIPDKYKIYKKEDKDEIVNKVLDYQLIDDAPSRITFNRVMKFMTDTLGYTIESGRLREKKKQYTYKLVVDFDEDYESQNDNEKDVR